MIIIKFEKTNRFLSHIDILHSICRTIRRAKLSVNYSEGFNPHERIYLSNPTSLGLETCCEYATIDSDCDAKEFMQKFNEFRDGIEILKAKNTPLNPNFAATICASKYLFVHTKIQNYQESLEKIFTDENFVLPYKKSDKTVKLADRLLSFEFSDGKLEFIVGSANNNLKADELSDFIFENMKESDKSQAYSLKKIAQFYKKDDKLLDIDSIFN